MSDKKIAHYNANGVIDYYTADVITANDYYPFGQIMPGRNYNAPGATDYRYGFNGKENDNDVKGEGNQQDYGERIYDPRLGKFLSVDPLTPEYPMLTPYQFASNRPLDGIDQDGLEWKPVTGADGNVTDYTWSGFNADGSAVSGTDAGGSVVKNGSLYSYSSTSIAANPSTGYGGFHSGSFSVDDGSNITMSASIFGNRASYSLTEVNEDGNPLTIFNSGHLGNAAGASGEDIATALDNKYKGYVIDNTPTPPSGAIATDGLGPVDFLFGSGEAKLAAGALKYGAVVLMKAEAKYVVRQVFTKVEIAVARRAAVRIAWKEEKKLVQATGKGTRNWTKAETKELLKNGKVKGYQGHHINSVNGNTRLAGNPNNIDFVKGSKGNLKAHGGNFQNPTTGPLKNRKIKK